MHARWHVASSLFKIFLPHLNILKYLGSLTTGLSVTKGSSCSVSSIAYFSLYTLFWTHSGLLSSVELSSVIMIFDLPSSVEQTCDIFSSTRNFFLFVIVRRTNVRYQNVSLTSHFRSYRVNFRVEGIISHHTLCKAVLLGKNNCQWDHVCSSYSHNFYKAIYQNP